MQKIYFQEKSKNDLNIHDWSIKNNKENISRFRCPFKQYILRISFFESHINFCKTISLNPCDRLNFEIWTLKVSKCEAMWSMF